MGVYHGFEKNETATMSFLKKEIIIFFQKVYYFSGLFIYYSIFQFELLSMT